MSQGQGNYLLALKQATSLLQQEKYPEKGKSSGSASWKRERKDGREEEEEEGEQPQLTLTDDLSSNLNGSSKEFCLKSFVGYWFIAGEGRGLGFVPQRISMLLRSTERVGLDSSKGCFPWRNELPPPRPFVFRRLATPWP
jgi:hypothetical protein